MHVIAGKAVAFKEAGTSEFKAYQQQVVKNARTLASTLISEGLELVSGGTDNHLMLVKLTDKNITGKELEHLLDECHITVNKNAIPNDPQSPFVTSGIRVGTPAVTSRGMKEEDMTEIGKLIASVVRERENALESVGKRVAALYKEYPLYAGLDNL